MVGHARLSECFESYGGAAAAVTYVIVDKTARGQGLGRQLMLMVENEARRLGYHYLYLWTKDAAPFYLRCG
jgi:GNAT superfamily N-acetyltransferase